MVESNITDLNSLFTVVLREAETNDIQEIDSNFYISISILLNKIKNEEYNNIEAKTRDTLFDIFSELVSIFLKARLCKSIKLHTFVNLLDEEQFILESNDEFKTRKNTFLSAALNGRHKFIETISNSFKTKLVVVRFLKSLDEIIGFDFNKYGPFEIEDVANVPNKNAQVLINKKIVEKITF